MSHIHKEYLLERLAAEQSLSDNHHVSLNHHVQGSFAQRASPSGGPSLVSSGLHAFPVAHPDPWFVPTGSPLRLAESVVPGVRLPQTRPGEKGQAL